jgi:hypothetical protein
MKLFRVERSQAGGRVRSNAPTHALKSEGTLADTQLAERSTVGNAATPGRSVALISTIGKRRELLEGNPR